MEIDLMVNGACLTLAHDAKSLDAYDELQVAMPGGAATLHGAGLPPRHVGTVLPSMLAGIGPGTVGQSIRVSGLALARIAPLSVTVRREA